MSVLRKNATAKKLINTVEIVFSNSFLLCSFSPILLIIPEEKPKVETPSNDDEKLLRFPTKAIPLGPTKTANNFEVIKPVPIFNSTFKLFKEVILNRSVCTIFFIKSNLIFV